MAKTTKSKFDLNNLASYRHGLGLNQQAFWKPLGLTQSGGSRYEGSRNIPMPAAILLVLRETGKISNVDLEAAAAVVKKARAKR